MPLPTGGYKPETRLVTEKGNVGDFGFNVKSLFNCFVKQHSSRVNVVYLDNAALKRHEEVVLRLVGSYELNFAFVRKCSLFLPTVIDNF